ncbi:MAG: UMP kinase [Chloroflexi bacterium]|nr:UMP kinase [Chloroflexota bacterium]
MQQTRYKRAVLKLSGEALRGESGYGIDLPTLRYVANHIKRARDLGVTMGVVVGGGNIWRGAQGAEAGMDRTIADYAGMLATVINALALQDALEKIGVDVRTQTAIPITNVAEPYIYRRAMHHLDLGRVVIFAAGTGNPYMTTDTAAALRAIEIHADVLLMAKNGVDGVYDADPRKARNAKKFAHVTYMEALSRRLNVMDSTALSMCMDNRLPIIVFDIQDPRCLEKALTGKKIGTLVSGDSLPSEKGA